MTDKELLELAAKAAGIECYWDGISNTEVTFRHRSGGYEWNPLTDDGDALRLAVKLNMGISIPVMREHWCDVVCFKDSSVNIQECSGDPYAATRRAIVRAAAEIGKTM